MAEGRTGARGAGRFRRDRRLSLRRSEPCAGPGEAGFAAVDALVGLMILTITIVLSFNALTVARDLTASALEARQAAVLLSFLMESSPSAGGTSAGHEGTFDWKMDAEPPATNDAGVHLCRRSASVTARASHRIYAASAVAICRSQAAA